MNKVLKRCSEMLNHNIVKTIHELFLAIYRLFIDCFKLFCRLFIKFVLEILKLHKIFFKFSQNGFKLITIII